MRGALLLLLAGSAARAADYRVGPGQPCSSIGEVPWDDAGREDAGSTDASTGADGGLEQPAPDGSSPGTDGGAPARDPAAATCGCHVSGASLALIAAALALLVRLRRS
ncbi:MAG: hypothetical protein HYZ28_16655 [Myxococcales bacterium]|nr:hypothetical protein [Myxococcales bacterium]